MSAYPTDTATAAAGDPTLSAASVTGPGIGLGTDPGAAASAAQGPYAAAGASGLGQDDGSSNTTIGGVTLPFDADERPEFLVGAAFAGGFLLAQALKVVGR